MRSVEVSGRTLEEALSTAAEELGVAVEALEYTVIEEGGKGFLGLGLTPYQIRASAPEREAAARPVAAAPVAAAAAPAEAEHVAPEQQSAEEAPVAGESDSHGVLLEILSQVLAAMNVDAKPVLKSEDGEFVCVDIVGKDVAILIGKHGQTLDALQYLMTLAMNTKTASAKRVTLDAEGYRERHQKILEKKALEYATAVAEQQKEAVLDPQPARDRRIVHVALAEHPDVYTYSEGEGDERHVVISPKK